MAVARSNIGGLLPKHGYQEIRKVGEGSFGKALLVQKTSDKARLICKMVDVSKAPAQQQQDAVKEAKLLAELHHPCIVNYCDAFNESGWLCILMDFCEGGELAKQIEQARKSNRTLSEQQVVKWLTQAIMALQYIHGRHLLHRDLKPANFFLTHGDLRLRMGDFGIAKVLDCTMAAAKTQIGTLYYLSPELCAERTYSWHSDIWAMGCILYELCALKVPFDAKTIPELVQKITEGEIPTIPSPYSSFLKELCGQMLDRKPDERPSPEQILVSMPRSRFLLAAPQAPEPLPYRKEMVATPLGPTWPLPHGVEPWPLPHGHQQSRLTQGPASARGPRQVLAGASATSARSPICSARGPGSLPAGVMPVAGQVSVNTLFAEQQECRLPEPWPQSREVQLMDTVLMNMTAKDRKELIDALLELRRALVTKGQALGKAEEALGTAKALLGRYAAENRDLKAKVQELELKVQQLQQQRSSSSSSSSSNRQCSWWLW